jgi:hypothetical protein
MAAVTRCRPVIVVVVMVTITAAAIGKRISKNAGGNDSSGRSGWVNGLHRASVGIVSGHARGRGDDNAQCGDGFDDERFHGLLIGYSTVTATSHALFNRAAKIFSARLIFQRTT